MCTTVFFKYLTYVSTRNIGFTNIVLVCDGQYFLCVCVHLLVTFNNSNIHAVVKVMYTTLLLSLEYK